MVHETRETMTKMFDSMNDAFKSAMDAGRRSQEAWFRAFGDMARTPANFDAFRASGEQVTKEWIPFIERNVETFTQTCDSGFRTGMDAFQTAFNVTIKANEGDFFKNSREALDASVNAFQANVDTVSKAGVRTVENCANFVQASICESAPAKAAPKTANK